MMSKYDFDSMQNFIRKTSKYVKTTEAGRYIVETYPKISETLLNLVSVNLYLMSLNLERKNKFLSEANSTFAFLKDDKLMSLIDENFKEMISWTPGRL